MRQRTIVVRHDGPFSGWSVWLDGERASVPGVPRRKVAAFVDGLETGLALADPDTYTDTVVEDEYLPLVVARRAARVVLLGTVSLAVMLLALGSALYAILNVIEVIRIAASDWDGWHFAQHVALQVAATGFAWVYFFGQARMRARWRRLPRF